MDKETIGFFVGMAPGAVIIFLNMWRQHTLQRQIQTVAWREQSWSDTQGGLKQQFDLLFHHPDRSLCPGDSSEPTRAKQALLSAWPQLRRRHWIGGCVAVVGAVAGVAAGALLA